MAIITGNGRVRAACKDYIGWVLAQRSEKNIEVTGLEQRNDVEAIPVPEGCTGHIAGKRGSFLRSIETSTGTFCFVSQKKSEPRGSGHSILIFSTNDESRRKARAAIERTVDYMVRKWGNLSYRHSSRSRSHSRSRSRSRSSRRTPSPSRRTRSRSSSSQVSSSSSSPLIKSPDGEPPSSSLSSSAASAATTNGGLKESPQSPQ